MEPIQTPISIAEANPLTIIHDAQLADIETTERIGNLFNLLADRADLLLTRFHPDEVAAIKATMEELAAARTLSTGALNRLCFLLTEPKPQADGVEP